MDNVGGLIRPHEYGAGAAVEGGGGDGDGGSRKVGDEARRNLSFAGFAAVPSSSSYEVVVLLMVLLSMASSRGGVLPAHQLQKRIFT